MRLIPDTQYWCMLETAYIDFFFINVMDHLVLMNLSIILSHEHMLDYEIFSWSCSLRVKLMVVLPFQGEY